jgi:hypothetical protein
VKVAEGLRSELLELGAVDATAELVGTLLRDARDAAGDDALAGEYALAGELGCGLRELLESLEQGYFARR